MERTSARRTVARWIAGPLPSTSSCWRRSMTYPLGHWRAPTPTALPRSASRVPPSSSSRMRRYGTVCAPVEASRYWHWCSSCATCARHRRALSTARQHYTRRFSSTIQICTGRATATCTSRRAGACPRMRLPPVHRDGATRRLVHRPPHGAPVSRRLSPALDLCPRQRALRSRAGASQLGGRGSRTRRTGVAPRRRV